MRIIGQIFFHIILMSPKESPSAVAAAPRKENAVDYKNSGEVRRVLMQKLSKIEGVMSLSQDSLSASIRPPISNQTDGALEQSEEDVDVLMIGSAQEQLEIINRAIDKTREGTHRKCDACGLTIPLKRLKAFGGAVVECVKCVGEAEKGQRVY